MTNRNQSLGILSTFGHSTNSASFLERLVLVVSSLHEAVHVVAPDKAWRGLDNVSFYPVRYSVGRGALAQAVNQAIAQLSMSWRVAKLHKRVDYWIFYGGDFLLLPALAARLFKARVLLALAGNLENEARLKKNILNKPQIAMRKTVFGLSERIILYSGTLIGQWRLERYAPKVIVADSHFLDLDRFRIDCPLDRRPKVVGYVGRLSEEKGVLNLAKAMPLVLREEPDIRFLVVGSGPIEDRFLHCLDDAGIGDKVKLTGRVAPEMVPSYLNQLTLCVLPSYTEGMPNVVLESMACGTPVVATPVGAVADLIEDGKTGFLAESNDPECLAAIILKALRDRGLKEIAVSARRYVEGRFTFETARQSYGRIVALMRGGHGNSELAESKRVDH